MGVFFPNIFFPFCENFLVGLGRKYPDPIIYFSFFPLNQTYLKKKISFLFSLQNIFIYSISPSKKKKLCYFENASFLNSLKILLTNEINSKMMLFCKKMKERGFRSLLFRVWLASLFFFFFLFSDMLVVFGCCTYIYGMEWKLL